jgi:hypothetical protein
MRGALRTRSAFTRRNDPLYRIRKLLLSGAERFDERGSSKTLLAVHLGDSDDAVLGAWLVGVGA